MKLKKLFKTIYKVSEKVSMDAYVVGGYVRDELLDKKEIKDIDFVVLGSGLEFAKIFDKEMKKKGSLIEFADFDTARYVFDELDIEFAGARSEKYEKGSRKPDVKPATLEQDLSRRDFTINAIARKVEKKGLGEAVDPYDGQKDLKNKILRTPLDPNETFYDDPLRMIRAARFAAQLGFSIEKQVLEAMSRNAKRLKIISAERITEELFKLLAAPKPSVGLQILYGTKLLDEFLPEVSELSGVEEVSGYKHKDNLSHTFDVVDNIANACA
jgi:tRNA nucleotidyltransferase (CCA-adding enzyme)